MRSRYGRLLSQAHLDRSRPVLLTTAERATAEAALPKPDELTWWDWTVFLFHAAAEIEHALLVQYLFAGYSLADRDFRGTDVPADAAARTARWRSKVLAIAREEMAHLLTVQNLLLFVGGPMNLEREDFPFRSLLYPFPLSLEPMTRGSLAKYVAAEMPEGATSDPPELIDEIVERAAQGTGGRVNRVGVVYEALAQIVGDAAKLTDADLRPDASQATAAEWFAFGRLIVRAVHTRAEAVSALQEIGAQGEGSETPSPETSPSHFETFLQIYKEFPEEDDPEGSAAWVPSRRMAANPNTAPDPSDDPDVERSRITASTTRLWAHLFNVRYRMLLVDLAHALRLPTGGATPLRQRLRDWTFQEMRGTPLAGLRGLAAMLTTLPLKEASVPEAAAMAGPPFELPYTLALPEDERGRWRLHLALLDASASLIASIRSASGASALLTELETIDAAARSVVQAQLAP